MAEDIRDYGATPDDGTDDSQAFREAANAAGKGGTIRVPAGTYRISSSGLVSAQPLQFGKREPAGISIVGDGPSKSIIKWEDGYDGRDGSPRGAIWNDDYDHGNVVVRDVTFDGNWQNLNLPSDGKGSTGWALEMHGDPNSSFTIERTILKGWWTNGALAIHDEGKVRFNYCSFIECGLGSDDVGQGSGHGFNASATSGTIVAENCYWNKCSGTAVDMTKDAGGNLEIRNSFAHNLGDAFVKKNQGTGTLRVRNVHVVPRDSWIQNGNLQKLESNGNYCFYAVPKNQDDVGVIDIEHLWVENLAEPFVHYSQDGGGTIQGAGPVRVERSNLVNRKGRDSAFFIDTVTSRTHVSIDKLSIHGVRNADGLFNFTSGTADGNIGELHRGSDSVIGNTDQVSIDTDNASGVPLTVTVPSRTDVGALQGDESNTVDTPEYKILEVVPNTDTVYSITVTGDAGKGSNADGIDEITRTQDGNVRIDGKVLVGGLDSYRFTGDILKSMSKVEGDATVFVNGTEISLTNSSGDIDGFASYTLPSKGSLDWHVPLNANFDQVSTDIKHLAERIDNIENQLS